ncbi:hypothetical protein D5S18_19410 [Nocardia panacis]|uniref:Leucine-rich repeat domain-containing protein n=1 Tax=Nocardia panacis TaxID=2340916 RepID=A0A3A4KG26_9NOCA|nr:hypothetical protein [Nocardia panacis]RJO73399.1 hypothetical protein D5S18_19410 [Nocardia panacis]
MNATGAVDSAGLEQRLRDNPDDPATWRAYGEWLDGCGDARGRLIRLEQERARIGPGDRSDLDREIAALTSEHQQGWDAELPSNSTCLARRHGFATKVGIVWSDDEPTLIAQALRQRFVTALRIEPDPRQDSFPFPDYNIGANGPQTRIEVDALATIDLGRLVELDLAYLRLGGPGAKALAAAGDPTVARLEMLDLRYSRVGDVGIAALAGAGSFAGVRRIHLQRNLITAVGVRALHGLTRLTELDLRYNNIGVEGVRALLEAPFIGSLTRLWLYRADVGEDGARMLASAPQLPPALRSYWRSV